MKVEKYTKKSHSFNEDRFIDGKLIKGVIDGATDLSDKPSYRSRSHASKLSKILKDALEKFHGGDEKEYVEFLSRLVYSSAPELKASCGLAFTYFDGETVRLYSVGDCEIAYKLKDGTMHRFKQTDLEKLDGKALAMMVEKAKEKGISVLSARKYINDTLRYHRSLMNTDGGYSVFAPMENPTFRPLTLWLDADQVDEILIYTDGFAQSFTTLNILPSFESLFDISSVKDVCDQIVKVSFEDKDCNRFPRFKTVDDITVVRIKL